MSAQNFQENIILPALEIIKNDTKVKKFYFLPWLFSIVFLSILLVYQAIYTYVIILGKREEALEIILNLFHSQYVIEIIVTSIVFLLIYILMIPVFEGGLIRYIDQKTQWFAPSSSDALGFGIFRFYPVFEFNNIFSMFKFISIVNGYLFAIRFLGLEYLSALSVTFGIAFLFSLIVNTLTAYARYEIVLENKTVFQAIASSSQIALLNLKTTLKLYVMMFILNIRVIINFFLFLAFPLIFLSLVGFVTSQIFLTIAAIILGGLFIAFVLFLWYMTGVLEVLSTSIWYYAYKEGKKKMVDN